MKPYDLVKENVQFILFKTDEKVGKKAKKEMLDMYWKIGFELRDFDNKEMMNVVRRLSRDLRLDFKLFILSYEFYKYCPMYRKTVRCAR
jgi:methionine salvage enolase-phosphatase E1